MPRTDWEQVVRDRLGGPLARRGDLVRELAGFLEDACEEGRALGDTRAEAEARVLDAAGDWSELRRRIEEEEVQMRARRVVGLAAAAALMVVAFGGFGWRAARQYKGPLPPMVTAAGRPCAELDARTCVPGEHVVSEAVARKIAVSPPSRPIPELLALLESSIATDRVEAARQLAGAPSLPDGVATRLKELQRDDPDERVRLAVARAVGLLRADGVVEAAKLAGEPPELIETTRPQYPDDAFRARLQGTVVLLLLINERGHVAQVEVRESIPGLEEAAVASARDWTFRPARDDGRPVPAAVIAPVAFGIY